MSLTSEKSRKAYVTQCKICKLAIFDHQARRWSTSPLGLVHEICP